MKLVLQGGGLGVGGWGGVGGVKRNFFCAEGGREGGNGKFSVHILTTFYD